MLETFAALFFAHVVADYVAQTSHMVRHKHETRIILLHLLVVLACSAAALGFVGWGALLALTVAHGIMDVVKTHVLPENRLWPYIVDQAVHIATIVIVSISAPALFSIGVWGRLGTDGAALVSTIFLLAGFAIFAIRAGGFAADLALRPFSAPPQPSDLLKPSRWFGHVERALVFGLTVIGQPLWVAVLIVVKSGLRVGIAGGDRAALQQSLIGMAASLGWAICTALVLLMVLPNGTLETLRLTP